MLTDDKERFIKFAEIPLPEAEHEVLCAYDLTPFTGKKDHWVVALQDPTYGAYTTTWCGDDWRAEPVYDASYGQTDEAKAAAFGYALAMKEAKS